MTRSLDFPHTPCPHLRTAYRRSDDDFHLMLLPHTISPRFSYEEEVCPFGSSNSTEICNSDCTVPYRAGPGLFAGACCGVDASQALSRQFQ